MIKLSEHLTPHDQVRRDELHKAFREISRTPAGKRVLFWLLEQCSVYSDPFCGESTNDTHYSLGRQGVGRRLLAMIDEIDPRLYPQLLLDAAQIREIDNAAGDALAKALGEDDGAD